MSDHDAREQLYRTLRDAMIRYRDENSLLRSAVGRVIDFLDEAQSEVGPNESIAVRHAMHRLREALRIKAAP